MLLASVHHGDETMQVINGDGLIAPIPLLAATSTGKTLTGLPAVAAPKSQYCSFQQIIYIEGDHAYKPPSSTKSMFLLYKPGDNCK
jgi:hypothetical protein